MASREDFQRIALSFPGTTSAQHFDRTAFKVARIYATLSSDGMTANLLLAPDEQILKCTLAPEIFSPVPNAWGKQGWTTLILAAASEADLSAALEMAHAHAQPKRRARRTRL